MVQKVSGQLAEPYIVERLMCRCGPDPSLCYKGGTLCCSGRRARGGQGNNWLWLRILFKVERAFGFIFFFAIIWNKPKALQKGQRMLETLNASLADSWPTGFRTDINCLFREMGSSVSPTAVFFFFFFPHCVFYALVHFANDVSTGRQLLLRQGTNPKNVFCLLWVCRVI